MKLEAIDHPKMKRLCRSLKIPLPYANGILERLWHGTANHAPDGGIGRFSDDEIAAWCGVELHIEPAELTSALLGAGWLDPAPSGIRFQIHDWAEHCGPRVHRRLAVAGIPFVSGQVPHLKGLGKNERKRSIAKFEALGLGAGIGNPAPGLPNPAPETHSVPPARKHTKGSSSEHRGAGIANPAPIVTNPAPVSSDPAPIVTNPAPVSPDPAPRKTRKNGAIYDEAHGVSPFVPLGAGIANPAPIVTNPAPIVTNPAPVSGTFPQVNGAGDNNKERARATRALELAAADTTSNNSGALFLNGAAAAASGDSKGGPSSQFRWPKTAKLIRGWFADTEDRWIDKLAERCRAVITELGEDPNLLTDEVFSNAVKESHRPHQRSAGLFARTAVQTIRTWTLEEIEEENHGKNEIQNSKRN